MNVLAGIVLKHRWWVIGGWVAAIVVIQVLASGIGGSDYKDDFKLPGTESQTVSDLLTAAGLSQQNNASGTLVLHVPSGDLATEPVGFIKDAQAAVCGVEAAHVATITTPWGSVDCSATTDAVSSAPRPDLLSPDKKVALVEIGFDTPQPGDNVPKAAYDALKTLRSDDLGVEFTGNTFAGVGVQPPAISPELLGFLAALIILAIVFRTLGTTVLPLLCAGAALGAGLGLMAILSHGLSIASWAPSLATLMMIGVGIDYALFVVTRHRRNLRRGMSVEDSISSAMNTSGRAVLFAGITVCISILGLCALGVSFLYGLAIGTAIGVALTMVASLTLLPALLSLLGRRALPRSQRDPLGSDHRVKVLLCVIPPICVVFWVLYGLQRVFRPMTSNYATRRATSTRQPFWMFWATLVRRRSLTFALLASLILIVLAIPFFSLRLGNADQSTDPAGSTTRQGYDLIQSAFGRGYNSELQLVISGPGASDKQYLESVTEKLASLDNVDPNSITTIPATDNIAIISFKTESGPQDAATTDLVKDLRSDALPALYQGTDNHIYVYGETAIFIDFSKVLSAKMPYFFLAVVGLSFLLLMLAFRSLAIPMTAAVMNLLAAGASFGIIVAIFQWGWFGDHLGVGAGGPISAFMPVLFFAILFGLSMDYQVFLVSRIHEEWIHTGDNGEAVTVGQAQTGGIITAAGLIMIVVFAGFALDPDRTIKMLGIGLASAVFVDAFIVRTMLSPAIMHRLGTKNWWYPAWLDKVTPHVSIEPPDEHAAPEQGPKNQPAAQRE